MSQSIQQAFSKMSKTASTKRKAGTAVADNELLARGSSSLAPANVEASPTAPKSPVRKKSRTDVTTSPVGSWLASTSQKVLGAKAALTRKPTPTAAIGSASKLPARGPVGRTPSFGQFKSATGKEPTPAFQLGDAFSERGIPFPAQGRAGGVVTPDLEPKLAAMQLEGAAYRDLNIDPTLYEETFHPSIPPPSQDPEDWLMNTTPKPSQKRPARSSKNDLDLLSHVMEAVETVKLAQKDDKKERKKICTVLETLTDRMEKIEGAIHELSSGSHLGDIRNELATIRDVLQSLTLGAESGSDVKKESAAKSDPDEVTTKLVKTYRAAMLAAMRISEGSKLPPALTDDDRDEYQESTMYYLVKSEEDGTKYSSLRPNFSQPLGKQSEWHDSIISIVKKKGEAFGFITKDVLQSRTDSDHKDALQRCYKSLRTAYQYQQKGDDDKDQKRQLNRRRNRRFGLASARRDCRKDLPPVLLEPEWDFLFDAGYTSDQLSADEEAIVNNAGLVAELGKGNKFEIIRSPRFQRHEITRIKHELLDEAVRLRQTIEAKKLKGGKPKGAKRTPTAYDPRPLDRDLPSGILPFFALDEAWLGQQESTVSFFNPMLGSDDEDVDGMAEKGVIENPRNRDHRVKVYEDSLELVEDYTDGAPGRLLNRLVMSTAVPAMNGFAVADGDVEMGEGGMSMSESEGRMAGGDAEGEYSEDD